MKIPSNETLWETITTAKEDIYFVTSNRDRSTYFLYRQIDSGVEKVAKAPVPPELIKYIED